MTKCTNRNLILLFLRARVFALLFYVLFLFIGFVTFFLYQVILEPFLYTVILVSVFGVFFLILDFFSFRKKIRDAENQIDALLLEQENRLLSTAANERQDLIDYYTTWVHQIKTPISVMHLLLPASDPKNQELLIELFRIEQYVDMVLQYIRLDTDGSDLLVKSYHLDDIIRKVIRKFAPQFIHRKLTLHYEETTLSVTTDEKWLTAILEQLLSNAIKYTQEGCITIGLDHDSNLFIEDTGIGIQKEDLPRIFERGYTGQNGRLETKSSGLGLYLVKKACDMLSIKIQTKSTPGEGTRFTLLFPECIK